MKLLVVCFLSVILFTGITTESKGQGEEVTLDPVQVSFNILPLMAQAEFGLSDNQSITFGGGLGFSAYFESINGEESFEAFSTPFITASFRNYYKRKRVNKDNLKNNSGNYVGLYTSYQFDTVIDINGFGTIETELNSYRIGPVWGFQRNYASGIHLDLSLGLGFQGGQSDEFIEIENQLVFLSGFELGFKIK